MLKEDTKIEPLIYDNAFKHIFLDKPEMLMTIISKIIWSIFLHSYVKFYLKYLQLTNNKLSFNYR